MEISLPARMRMSSIHMKQKEWVVPVHDDVYVHMDGDIFLPYKCKHFFLLQVFRVKYQYFIFVCTSTERQITLGILYGYKALLQILAVILALKTRKVQVKGLDDSMYIIAATYLSSLVLLAVIIMTYTASDLINTYAVVSSTCFILGSTMIVGIVFIPKVCMHVLVALLSSM